MTMEKSLSDIQSSDGTLEATGDNSYLELSKHRKEHDARDILHQVSTSIEHSNDNINPLYEKTSGIEEYTEDSDSVRMP